MTARHRHSKTFGPSGASALLGFMLLAWPSAAFADDRGFILTWDAPADCPTAETVRRAVVNLVRAEHPTGPVRVHAKVTHDSDAFRVRLITHRQGARGSRDLEAPTCSALVEAVTIIIALSIDPELFNRDTPASARAPGSKGTADGAEPGNTSGSGDSAVAPEEADGALESEPAKPEADANAEDRASTPPVPHDPSSADKDALSADESPNIAFTDRGLQGLASLAGSVETGALPGLGFGVTVRGGIRRRRLRAEVAVSRWLPRDVASSEPGMGATFSATVLEGWGCFRVVPGHTAPLSGLRLPPDDQPAIEAGACLGAEVGQIFAESYGVEPSGSGNSGFASMGGALRLGATAADWLSLDVRIEALALLHRPKFELDGIGQIHQPEPWSLRASMGAEAYFP